MEKFILDRVTLNPTKLFLSGRPIPFRQTYFFQTTTLLFQQFCQIWKKAKDNPNKAENIEHADI